MSCGSSRTRRARTRGRAADHRERRTLAEVPLDNAALHQHRPPRCARSEHPDRARDDRAGRFPKGRISTATSKLADARPLPRHGRTRRRLRRSRIPRSQSPPTRPRRTLSRQAGATSPLSPRQPPPRRCCFRSRRARSRSQHTGQAGQPRAWWFVDADVWFIRPSGAQKPCTERAGAACSQTSFCIRRRARAIASGLQPRVLVLATSRARVGWGRAAHSWSLGHHGACPDSPRECENLRTPYVRRRPARCRWPSSPAHLLALARGGGCSTETRLPVSEGSDRTRSFECEERGVGCPRARQRA